MKALVTGGTGFVGSHIVDLLLHKGYTVRCLVRRTSDLKWLEGKSVEYTYGDLFTTSALNQAVAGVDYVYHSAGLTKAKSREEYEQGNAKGTKNILEATVRHNPHLKRFVLVSSGAAAGPSPTKEPITELTEPRPLTSYGKSKLHAELECHTLQSALPITIVRPPAVFGPRDKDVFEFFRTMSKGLQPMVGFGEKYVSLIHVTDLVRGIVIAGESEAARQQTYFITSKEFYGWKEIGEITRRELKRDALRLRIPEFAVYGIAAIAEFFALFSSKPALINFEKARDMVQDYWTFSHEKARRELGFEQQMSLEEGIHDTIAWCKTSGWL